MPPRTEAQLAEIKRLRAETLALLDWFERYQGVTYGAAIRAMVEKSEGSLPKMRAVARELRSFLGQLPKDLSDAIIASVEEHGGTSLAASETADAKRAEAIFRRGKVASEAEYYLLRTYLERVSNTPGREADVASILAILDGYSPSERAAT